MKHFLVLGKETKIVAISGFNLAGKKLISYVLETHSWSKSTEEKNVKNAKKQSLLNIFESACNEQTTCFWAD